MSTEKVYAIKTKQGDIIGDVLGSFENGRVACAGAVTIDGTPVNKFGVQLSLNRLDLEKASEMPRFKRMEKQTGEHHEVFITNYYNTLETED